MSNRVLVIGGKLDDGNYLRKVKALGLEVFAVQTAELADDAYRANADTLIVCDYERSETLFPMLAAAHRSAPFGAVVSLTESGLLPAARLNELLGLQATSLRTATLLKDKWAMRLHLNAAGVSPVRAGVGRDVTDLRAFAEEVGGPFIVKPVDGSGSTFVFLARDARDIASIAARIAKAKLATFLMEEFLDGPEISVETFSFDGSHVVIAMTDKWTDASFVEIGHAVPARMGESTHGEVEQIVRAFLDVVGLKNGPAHTELKLTARGPRIIESHNRIGGDKISELVASAYGVDMVSMTYAWAFGLCAPLTASPSLRAAAAIRFLTPAPGLVRAIRGADEVRADPRVLEVELEKKVGDRVHALGDSDDRSGHVIVCAPTRDEVMPLCERFWEQVVIETQRDEPASRPGPGSEPWLHA